MLDFSARDLLVTAPTSCTRTADWHRRVSRVGLLDTLRVWNERSRQRHALRLLSERNDYLLRDIGLSQDEAFREAAKPFWQR
jgi:uncharacterized protein YjiS (DUF1127 family)